MFMNAVHHSFKQKEVDFSLVDPGTNHNSIVWFISQIFIQNINCCSPRSVQHKSASYPSSINLLIEPLIPASTFSAVKPVAANSGIEKSMNVGSIPTTQSVRIRQCLFFILGCFFERDVTHPEFSVQQALQVSPKTPASRGNTFQPVSRSEYLPEGY